MNLNVIYDKKIFLEEKQIKVFPVKVIADNDAEILLKFSSELKATCYNCEGRDYLGNIYTKTVSLKGNRSQNFWCSVKSFGRGFLYISDKDGNVLFQDTILIEHAQKNKTHTENDSDDLKKIDWLNSDLYQNHDVPKGFDKVSFNDGTFKIMGRQIKFGKLGFPDSLTSYFNKSVKICTVPTEILNDKISFVVEGEVFHNESVRMETYDDQLVLHYVNQSDNFIMNVECIAEFDGFVQYSVDLTSKKDVSVNDIFLKIPMTADCLKYFIGLGKKGGSFDGKADWKWNDDSDQDCFWIGTVNAGVKFKFKGEEYVKPFVNIYYKYRKLKKPDCWDNNGKGGIYFKDNTFKAYSGSRKLTKGQSIKFNFDMLITPLKEIDLKKQFGMRIFHTMYDSDTWLKRAISGGANIINVHHGNDLNPYINYPFVEINALKDFIKDAHKNDILVKIYYTIRELTVNMPEFKVFKDLGYEIIAKRDGKFQGETWQSNSQDWVNENIGKDTIAAWRQPLKGIKYKDAFDAAVITEGQSRLCNFYIEGLKYLIDQADIDGIYIDDVAYDRYTMKRVRKALDVKAVAYIDFHQWNHYVDSAGFANCATLYMELYPYVDKCWIGEGFDYNESPEFWLIEMSGIPYGVMSEMMDTGNQYRGLLFGMTNRLGWETNEGSPENVWKIFDEYNLSDAELIGWWDDKNIVKLSNSKVLASEYIVKDKIYIVLANFSDEDVETDIYLNGLSDYSLYAPEIHNFQSESIINNKIIICGGKGLFLVAEQK